MKHIKSSIPVSIILFILCVALQNSCYADIPKIPDSESIDHAIRMVKPALVKIYALSTSYSAGREIKNESTGSGTIISPNGHIITNHHVVGHAVRLICTLSNNEEMNPQAVVPSSLRTVISSPIIMLSGMR